MASEESGQSESAGKGFQMKLGPLKVWQWGLIVIGGVVGIVIVRKLVGGGSGVASAVGTGAGTTGIGATSSAPAASTQDFASAIQNLSDSVTKQFAAQAAATQAVATQEQADVQAVAKQEQADVQALGAAQTTQGSALSTALNNAVGTLQSAIGQNAKAITSVGQIASQANATAANAQAIATQADNGVGSISGILIGGKGQTIGQIAQGGRYI